MNFSFTTCETCRTIVYSNYCNKCKKTVNAAPTVLKEAIELFKIETEVDPWIGPIETLCKNCNNRTVFYQMCDPISADEAAKIVFNCKTCKKVSSQYKN